MKQGWGHIVPSCPYKDWKNEGQGNRQITKHRRQHGRNILRLHRASSNILMKYQSFTWQCTISCVIRILLLIHCALSVKSGPGHCLGAAGSRIAHVVWFVRFPAKGLLCPFVGIFMWFSFDLDYELGLQKAVPIQHNAFAVTMEKLQVDRLTRFW